jgi:prolyl 4-hydroxylase
VANVAEGCDADFRAGLSLLAGSDAAQHLEEAVALVDAAAAAGHAEALERRAVFECAAVRRQADWEMALDSLGEAAEHGSPTAARQLILLADDRFETAPSVNPPPGGWSELRSRISIGNRLRSPANSGRTLSADPFIRAIPGICSAAECEWLIAAAAPRLERATLYNKGVGEGRTNQYAVLDLAHTDLVAEMVRARIANEIGAPVQCLEVSQVLRYGVGEEFMPHYDFLDPDLNREDIDRFGQRAATFLIYLNEDYDGGETSFPRLEIKHRGKRGDALVFGNLGRDGLPDPRTQHAGLPPTRGEKWLFSQWIRNRYAA